jgi:predicted RNase H-like HicB family nuclease
MQSNQKIHKIIFTITPNANGYVIGCNEIPSLFTDTSSIAEIDRIARDLLEEYIKDFPDDSQKRGFDKDTPIEITWYATPNSIALE